MSIRANNWINAGLKPLQPHQWLYWDIQYLCELYEDIKQDWSITDGNKRGRIADGIRYKYQKLVEAIDKELIDLPVPWEKVPKLKVFLLEWKETANEQLEFMLQMDFQSSEDLKELADLYQRMDKVINGASDITLALISAEDLESLKKSKK